MIPRDWCASGQGGEMTKHSGVVQIGDTDENADWIKTARSLEEARKLCAQLAKEQRLRQRKQRRSGVPG